MIISKEVPIPHNLTCEPIGCLIDGLGGGIETTPEVCGGEPRVAATRITVRTLEQYRRQGMTEAQLLDAYPTLRAADLVNAWAFVAAHPETIERLILDAEDGHRIGVHNPSYARTRSSTAIT